MNKPLRDPGPERLARTLMYAGAALAIVGVAAWFLDAIPPLPEWMLRLAVYKLTLAAAAGLIIVGAYFGRSLRASARRVYLGEGSAPEFRPARERDKAPDRLDDSEGP